MFFVEFLTRLSICCTGKTVKTTTDQRNLFIIGSDDVILPKRNGEKDMAVSLFYFIHPTNSNSRENSGIFVRFQCFLSNF